ncbi:MULTISPECIES: hypothetical protein [unclassified Streptomyces]|nr:hypothetical protein OG569_21340 [Streptomyces sp. NBC_00827]
MEDDDEHVSSARGDDHFETMRTQLGRHAKARPVRELTARAREVAALKS